MSQVPQRPRFLRKEAVYPHPPEVVWAALTDPQALAQWLMPNNFRAEVGASFQFRVDPAPFYDGLVDCEVLELDPPRRMVWSWMGSIRPGKPMKRPMRLEWTLAPDPRGTRLVLVQTDVDGLPWLLRMMMNFGWGTMFKRWLPVVLCRFDADPVHAGRFVYRRLDKAPNRGHHGVKTVPDGFFK